MLLKGVNLVFIYMGSILLCQNLDSLALILALFAVVSEGTYPNSSTLFLNGCHPALALALALAVLFDS